VALPLTLEPELLEHLGWGVAFVVSVANEAFEPEGSAPVAVFGSPGPTRGGARETPAGGARATLAGTRCDVQREGS
jgi:hypothetical protein